MPAHRRALVLAHLLFLGSGALGLSYEVLWARRFTTLFGSSTLATSATLSAVFLGIAIGSASLGLRSRRFRRPLLAFGILEIGVGLGALLTEPLLAAWARFYPGLDASLAGRPSFLAVKLTVALATLALPTICMGGTLPALARFAASSPGGLGVPVGGLYAANLAGAVAGTLAVPFLLLPSLGVDGTWAATVASSVVLGSAASVLGARSLEASSHDRGNNRSHARPHVWTPALLAALSGALTLAVQVLWVRAFSLVHASSLQAFAVVLATFLAGLAGGAALARVWLRRGGRPASLLGASWVGAGVFVAASPALFHRLTGGLEFLAPAAGAPSPLGSLLGLATTVVLPTTLALGTVLPLILESLGAVSPDEAGGETGRIVAANTLGAIAGPALSTFVLGPLLGLWPSFFVLGATLAAAGAWASRRSAFALTAVAGLAGVSWTMPPGGIPPVRVGAGERLLSVREDSYGTTAVLEDAQDRWITVNNSYVLGGSAEAPEERFQAHLPLLLHPDPREVALLGLGTGITAGAALDHPVEHVIAFEIVPQVVAAARSDFASANARVLEDPRVAVVVDDARPHLRSLSGRFDVIVTDLLVPWRPGEAALYTVEHLAAARRALKPGGVFCQWLPAYQLSEDQLAVAARTFVEVFPQATLWRGNFLPDLPTLALVGSTGPSFDPSAVDAQVKALAPRAHDPFLAHPAGFWLHFVGPVGPRSPGLSGARVNSDGHPWLELSSGATATRLDLPAMKPVPALVASASGADLLGTPLRSLGARREGWRRTGAELYRVACERRPESDVLALLATLPAELQAALGSAAPRATR